MKVEVGQAQSAKGSTIDKALCPPDTCSSPWASYSGHLPTYLQTPRGSEEDDTEFLDELADVICPEYDDKFSDEPSDERDKRGRVRPPDEDEEDAPDEGDVLTNILKEKHD